jgi:protein-S-isoprenylcysteine O-methyltransferase Ste14
MRVIFSSTNKLSASTKIMAAQKAWLRKVLKLSNAILFLMSTCSILLGCLILIFIFFSSHKVFLTPILLVVISLVFGVNGFFLLLVVNGLRRLLKSKTISLRAPSSSSSSSSAYPSVLLILFTVYFLLGVIGLSSFQGMEKIIEANMFEAFDAYDEGLSNKSETRRVDWLHERFACCGLNSSLDWHYFPLDYELERNKKQADSARAFDEWLVNNDLREKVYDVPDTCCKTTTRVANCGKFFKTDQNQSRLDLIHTNGCYQFYIKHFRYIFSIIFSLSIACSVFCLLAFIASQAFIKFDKRAAASSNNSDYILVRL